MPAIVKSDKVDQEEKKNLNNNHERNKKHRRGKKLKDSVKSYLKDDLYLSDDSESTMSSETLNSTTTNTSSSTSSSSSYLTENSSCWSLSSDSLEHAYRREKMSFYMQIVELFTKQVNTIEAIIMNFEDSLCETPEKLDQDVDSDDNNKPEFVDFTNQSIKIEKTEDDNKFQFHPPSNAL